MLGFKVGFSSLGVLEYLLVYRVAVYFSRAARLSLRCPPFWLDGYSHLEKLVHVLVVSPCNIFSPKMPQRNFFDDELIASSGYWGANAAKTAEAPSTRIWKAYFILSMLLCLQYAEIAQISLPLSQQ